MIYACVSVCVCDGVLFSHKVWNCVICNNVNVLWELYAKWNKSEEVTNFMISFICIIKKIWKKKNKTQVHGYTEWMVAWAKGSGISNMGERDQNIQIYS